MDEKDKCPECNGTNVDVKRGDTLEATCKDCGWSI